jgi:hypothetical protein
MMSALAEVCQVDVTLMRGKLAGMAKQLLSAAYTPGQVREGYAPGNWWYRMDFRGKQNQVPTLEQVVATIKQAVTGPQTHGPQFTRLPDGSIWTPSGSPAARGE